MNCFEYCRKCVFKGLWWTIHSWFCVFVLYCIVLLFRVSFENALHFLPCVVYKTKLSLTVFECRTILIRNVSRLLCKSMFSTMFIKMCVKLKHIHLASYFGVVTETYFKGKCRFHFMSKISLKLCKFSP